MIIFGGDRTAPLKAKEHGFHSKTNVSKIHSVWVIGNYSEAFSFLIDFHDMKQNEGSLRMQNIS